MIPEPKLKVSEIPETDSILLVDDDPDFLECLTSKLQKIEGLRVEAVDNAIEAGRRIKNSKYNLVVSDWVLSPTTGPEWIKRANSSLVNSHSLRGKTPVIFISGSDRIALTRRIVPMEHFIPISFIHKASGANLIVQMIKEFLRREPLPTTGHASAVQ